MARERAGLTQQQAVDKMKRYWPGLNQGNLSTIERSDDLRFSKLAMMCEVYGITVIELLNIPPILRP